MFGDRREAATLLRPHLPAPLADALNWSTVTLLNRSYIDDDARASELDLLFTIERNADQAPLALYVLLEHQSEPKRYMRPRLLKYCCRIWEQAEQEAGRLRAIVPVVLYQGRQRWPWPTELSELFTPVERGRQEGRQEGRLETLEQLVRSGVEWPLIESAAGNDLDTLRALKERLDPEHTNGHADGADQPEPPR